MKNNSPSLRLDLLISVLGVIGALIFFGLYDQAFPAAALDLKLSRQEVEAQAAAEAARLGFEPQGYTSALSFAERWSGSMFLQRQLGIAEANRLIREEDLPVWYWHMRWFKPLQQEEFSLRLAPDGRVVGFDHTQEENAPGRALAQDEARRLADDYLTHEQGLRLEDWEEVSASSQDRPGVRRDHSFEWKRKDFNAGGGELRAAVTVAGERVDSYDTWIKAPEAFLRRVQEQSNKANFLDEVAFLLGIGGFGLAGCTLVGLHLLNFGRPRRRALWVAAAVAVVSLLTGLNSLPLSLAGYDTTESLVQFWAQILFSGALGLAALVAVTLIIWQGGERAARLAWPRQGKALPLEGDRWVNLARSAWRGLMAAGILGGYIVVFYLVAVRLLGSWAPMDVSYSDSFATPFPFLDPIAGGLLPAVSEETIFRFIGVSLFVWLFSRLPGKPAAWRTFLAVLIPGALWAFAHVSYVRDPYYLRGIEILIPAVLLYGLLYVRFDLTTTLMMHMTYNAMLGALPMLRSDEPYFVFSGVVVVLLLLAPLAPGVIRRLKRRDTPAAPEIRRAQAGDLSDLLALPAPELNAPSEESEAEGASAAAESEWTRLLDDPQRAVALLRAGGRAAGYAIGRAQGDAGWIEAVYVVPELRGRYHGSRLVDALKAELGERGATSVRAQIAAGEHDGRGFLAALDWSPKSYVFGPDEDKSKWRFALRRRKRPEERPGFQTENVDL